MADVLPTGTVTLLLGDVEGSTRLWESEPEQMTAALALLDRTVAEIVAAHGGVRPVEQGEGDSFVVAFARASDAVACALDLQRAPLEPIMLRIGVHTGDVQVRDEGNYVGPTINKTDKRPHRGAVHCRLLRLPGHKLPLTRLALGQTAYALANQPGRELSAKLSAYTSSAVRTLAMSSAVTPAALR